MEGAATTKEHPSAPAAGEAGRLLPRSRRRACGLVDTVSWNVRGPGLEEYISVVLRHQVCCSSHRKLTQSERSTSPGTICLRSRPHPFPALLSKAGAGSCRLFPKALGFLGSANGRHSWEAEGGREEAARVCLLSSMP